jgi:hypothetical protein
VIAFRNPFADGMRALEWIGYVLKKGDGQTYYLLRMLGFPAVMDGPWPGWPKGLDERISSADPAVILGC